MKKFAIGIGILAIFIVSCTSTNEKKEETKDSTENRSIAFPEDTQGISEVITRFVRAYISQDAEKANALIHPQLGLYIIYRPGASDRYERVDRLDFKHPIPEHFSYTRFENDYPLTFDKLPTFDCGAETWDKLGFFCDTTSQADQLTKIAAFEHEYGETSADELKQIEELEKDTFRVILTKDENLIFHVKKYQDKWYVLVLDRAYGWCDA